MGTGVSPHWKVPVATTSASMIPQCIYVGEMYLTQKSTDEIRHNKKIKILTASF
jgi:hypothetical protein